MKIEQCREILNQNNSHKYTIKENQKIYNQLYILTEIIYEIIQSNEASAGKKSYTISESEYYGPNFGK